MARRRSFFPSTGPGGMMSPSGGGVARRPMGSPQQPPQGQQPQGMELPPPMDLQQHGMSPLPTGPFAERGPIAPNNAAGMASADQGGQNPMIGGDTEQMIMKLLAGMGRV